MDSQPLFLLCGHHFLNLVDLRLAGRWLSRDIGRCGRERIIISGQSRRANLHRQPSFLVILPPDIKILRSFSPGQLPKPE